MLHQPYADEPGRSKRSGPAPSLKAHFGLACLPECILVPNLTSNEKSSEFKLYALLSFAAILASAVAIARYADQSESLVYAALDGVAAADRASNGVTSILRKQQGIIDDAISGHNRSKTAAVEPMLAALDREMLNETARIQGTAEPASEVLAERLRERLSVLARYEEAALRDIDHDDPAKSASTREIRQAASEDSSKLLAAWRDQQIQALSDRAKRLVSTAKRVGLLMQGGAAFIVAAGAFGASAIFGRSRRNDARGDAMLTGSDAPQHRAQDAELQRANLLFETALSNMSQGLCLYNENDRLEVFNERFCELYGIAPGDLRIGSTIAEVMQLSIAAGNHPTRPLEDLLAGVKVRDRAGDLQKLANGRVIAISHRAMRDRGWVATYEDVTSRHSAEAQIAYMARHDALTGLENRFCLMERLDAAFREAEGGTASTVFCLDLDRFKTVNDTLGHPVGDGLLRAVAARLRTCIGEQGASVRLGGDEFAVVLVGVEGAERLATSIIESFRKPFQVDGHQINVGTSVGIAFLPAHGSTADILLKAADTALYRAKAKGRGAFCMFEPGMEDSLRRRRDLEIELREGFEREEFELYYQPLVNLTLDRVSGFEALLRWRHPRRGMVPPDEFIPIAEEIGLIVALGEWVIRHACAEATKWPDDVHIAVNLSPAQFKSGNLVGAVSEALADSGLRADRLDLEITESMLLREDEITKATMHELRALGARISLDDFGAGYSSLRYLNSFPFDRLKIDQSFIHDLCARDRSVQIVRAVMNLCGGLGIDVVAEGVETEEQLMKLRAEGCTEAQGFLFSHPKPPHDVSSMLRLTNDRAESFVRDAARTATIAS